MARKDFIKPKLQVEFQAEKLSRTIQNCHDISILKEIALELVKLNQQKISMINWALVMASDSKNYKKNQ